MTDEAAREGFNKLEKQSVHEPLYLTGLSRAIDDWVLGMNATCLYTLKYGRNRQVLSTEWVQTPTLALIMSRQKEIDGLKPETYWVLATIYRDTTFTATKGRFDKKEGDEVAFKTIEGESFTVTDVQKEKGTEIPPKLCDLTPLQVDYNKKFGYLVETTLNLIQSLYEKKYTTYPRTDTQYLSDDIYPGCPQTTNGLYQTEVQNRMVYAELVKPLGGKPLKKSKKVFGSSKATGHHVIISTGVSPMGLLNMEENMFDLIARRSITVFYDDCKFVTTIVMGKVKDIEFEVSGKEILTSGWGSVCTKNQREDDNADERAIDEEHTLSTSIKGKSGTHVPTPAEKRTTPPKYYTGATLLYATKTTRKFVDDEKLRAVLKENGIGRLSLYASVIETLFKCHYIQRGRKRIIATPLGIQLVDIVKKKLLTSCGLTGIWEKKLHDIEHRKYDVAQFVNELEAQITTIASNVLRGNSHPRLGTSGTSSK